MAKFKRFTLNLGQFIQKKELLIIKAINEALVLIKRRIDEKTPEDTKELVGNNNIIKAEKFWSKIIWKVQNKTGYAIYVEYWRSKIGGVPKVGVSFKYNKPKGTIFSEGVGARMFSRTMDEERDFIINLVRTKVLWKF